MAARSYDISIRLANGPAFPYMFGTKGGGLSLGHALKEPSAPSRVDTILITSLHHGAGRTIATDPEMLRDSNGEQVFCDTRQLGYIMPGGSLQLLQQIAIASPGDIPDLKAYAASFTQDDGKIVFGAGRQIIVIDPTVDTVAASIKVGAGDGFTGSVVEWNRDAWLGVMAIDGITTAAYNYDTDTFDTSDTYKFSWAASNRNAIFWFRNRTGAPPSFLWSDRTDQDFGAFNTNFVYPNNAGVVAPFILEIPKAFVTGVGVAGPYILYGSKGGNIWSFDRNEVFAPLTPANPGGFIDLRFGGPMSYVGSWILVPNLDGLGRFDPRNISLADISPSVHQGATPGTGTNEDKSAHYATPSPTGAVIAANLIGPDLNILQIEMYEDGMFYHPILLNLLTDVGSDISRVWGMIVTHAQDAGGNFISALRCYIIASNSDYSFWNIYRLNIATASWAPGPEVLADVSGFRTGFYTSRPPDVNGSPTQLRGYAQASEDNPINLFLEVDDSDEQYPLGLLARTGPFVLPVPNGVLPGRKFALAGKLTIGDQNEDPCFIMLPLSLDYRYVEASSPDAPDFFTLKFEASSDQINRITSHIFVHGRSEAEGLIRLTGESITVGFADSAREWQALVEDAEASLLYKEDGRTSSVYLVTLVCRRTA